MSERLFTETAYGTFSLGINGKAAFDGFLKEKKTGKEEFALHFSDYQKLANDIKHWVIDIAKLVVSKKPKIVGCTLMFEQIAASVAIINEIKKLSPNTITILGGTYCTGEKMCEGIASLSPSIDYVFSGECEMAFPYFIKQMKSGSSPKERIIKGSPCMDMDGIPTPDFTEFYAQLSHFMNQMPENLYLPFQSSRGCWWGEKKPCTFCGTHHDYFRYRMKSPTKVF
ncbi:MAG: hypothetical protein GY729_00625, partial [Desulfobacteraceae bacterium]|nr:hypothetical protein [Desulfobacteraceae bacterium]